MMVARLCADTAMIAPPLPMVLLLVCYVTLFVFSLPGTFHSWRQMLPLRGHIVPVRHC